MTWTFFLGNLLVIAAIGVMIYLIGEAFGPPVRPDADTPPRPPSS